MVIVGKRWELQEEVRVTNRFLFEHEGDVPDSTEEEKLKRALLEEFLRRCCFCFARGILRRTPTGRFGHGMAF
jgi:hypothetical protein